MESCTNNDSQLLSKCELEGTNQSSIQLERVGQFKTAKEKIVELPPFTALGKLKVFRRIPKAARISAARELTRRIIKVVNSNDVTSWYILFCFAPCFLLKPTKANKNSPSLATLAKRNIAVFDKDGPILSKLCQPLVGASRKKSKKNDEGNLSKVIS